MTKRAVLLLLFGGYLSDVVCQWLVDMLMAAGTAQAGILHPRQLECAPHETRCEAGDTGTYKCVDLQTDIFNCGGCNVPCYSPDFLSTCRGGKCWCGEREACWDGTSEWCPNMNWDHAYCGNCTNKVCCDEGIERSFRGQSSQLMEEGPTTSTRAIAYSSAWRRKSATWEPALDAPKAIWHATASLSATFAPMSKTIL